MKKLLALLLILCMVFCVGCADDGVVSQDDARKIAIEAMDVREKDVSETHIHISEYEGKPCFNVHLTVNGHSYEVIVDVATGEVLHKGDSSH